MCQEYFLRVPYKTMAINLQADFSTFAFFARFAPSHARSLTFPEFGDVPTSCRLLCTGWEEPEPHDGILLKTATQHLDDFFNGCSKKTRNPSAG